MAVNDDDRDVERTTHDALTMPLAWRNACRVHGHIPLRPRLQAARHASPSRDSCAGRGGAWRAGYCAELPLTTLTALPTSSEKDRVAVQWYPMD
jgi:hypothetical protein